MLSAVGLSESLRLLQAVSRAMEKAIEVHENHGELILLGAILD